MSKTDEAFLVLAQDFALVFRVICQTKKVNDVFSVLHIDERFADAVEMWGEYENFIDQIHKVFWGMVVEEDRQRFVADFTREHIYDTCLKGESFISDFRILYEGRPRYFSLKLTPVFRKGKITEMIGALQDVDRMIRHDRADAETIATQRTELSLREAMLTRMVKHMRLREQAMEAAFQSGSPDEVVEFIGSHLLELAQCDRVTYLNADGIVRTWPEERGRDVAGSRPPLSLAAVPGKVLALDTPAKIRMAGIPGDYAVKSLFVVPVVLDGQVWASFTIEYRNAEHSLSKDGIETLTLTAQILQQQLERSRIVQDRAAMASFMRFLVHDVESVRLEDALGVVARHLRASRVYLTRFDEANRSVRFVTEYLADKASVPVPDLVGVTYADGVDWMASDEQSIEAENVYDENAIRRWGLCSDINVKLGVCSLYCFKFSVGGKVWGAFGVSYEHHHHRLEKWERRFAFEATHFLQLVIERREHIAELKRRAESGSGDRALAFPL